MSSTGKFKGWRLTLGLIVVPLALAIVYYSFFPWTAMSAPRKSWFVRTAIILALNYQA